MVGISSLSFSNTGNGVYLSSSSELQQISLSARHTVAAGDDSDAGVELCVEHNVHTFGFRRRQS